MTQLLQVRRDSITTAELATIEPRSLGEGEVRVTVGEWALTANPGVATDFAGATNGLEVELPTVAAGTVTVSSPCGFTVALTPGASASFQR